MGGIRGDGGSVKGLIGLNRFECSGFFQGRIIVVRISLYLFTTSMEEHLSTHYIADISQSVFGWSKITLHITNSLANDYSDLIGPLVQYNDIHRLFTFGIKSSLNQPTSRYCRRVFVPLKPLGGVRYFPEISTIR